VGVACHFYSMYIITATPYYSAAKTILIGFVTVHFTCGNFNFGVALEPRGKPLKNLIPQGKPVIQRHPLLGGYPHVGSGAL